jgi:CheY-like chemotaxis protein
MVRELTVERLHVLGYDTLQASDGPTAVQMLKDHADFDLILTDIVMEGGMSGFDVAQWVQRNLPQCKILLTSGFSEQMAEANDVDIEKLQVLQKPHSFAELKQRINHVLEKTQADA